MADLVTRAALVMLAKTLHVRVEKVQHLEGLGAEKLDAIRHRIANTIFDDHAEAFRRISALVPVVPLKIAIPIVQATVPAAAAGRAAGAIGVDHPKKASATLGMVKVDYAADAAPYIDPRAVAKLAPLVEPESVVDIAKEILRRKDYITAALFVDSATPDLIRAVERGIDDDEGLMRAGAYVHNGTVIGDILRVIVESNPARISSVVRTAAEGPTDLRLAALSVLFRVDRDVIEPIGDVMFAETAPEVLADLFKSYIDEGVAPELLTFTSHLSSGAMDQLAHNPVLDDDEVLASVIRAAATNSSPDVWRGMLDIAVRASPEVQRRSVELLADIDTADLAAVPALATENDLWPHIVRLAAGQEAETQARVGEKLRPNTADADRERVDEAARELGLADDARPLLVALSR